MCQKGEEIYNLACELFPICRSITGNGVRETLAIIKRELPDLKIREVPTGTKCFDWTIPPEWNIKDAYVIDPEGKKIIDFRKSNLHIVGYSIPVNKTVTLSELQNHLYSLPDQMDAIPYITSYYERRWGFCITHRQRETLKEGNYKVYIDSTLDDAGRLTYGELIIPGKHKEEILLSTYVCHPSLANNELSGPVVTTYLAKWIKGEKHRRYTYRIIFLPETIGSIYYLSRNRRHLKKRVITGFNVSCVGDERTYFYLSSKRGNTLADRVALHVLKHIYPDFQKYSYLDRSSDERQYCSPGVDLPFVNVGRSKFGTYPEYHTSQDDLTLITPAGLYGGYDAIRQCLTCLERNEKLKVTVFCEPQLGKRNLYPTLSMKGSVVRPVKTMRNLITYADGTRDLVEIADIIGEKMWNLFEIVDRLKKEKILISCK